MPDRRAFLDTNILVYASLTDDSKAATGRALRDAGGTISVQVLNELANVLIRKAKWPWRDALDNLALIRQLLDIVPLTEDIHDNGLRLAERYSLSLYDAMIVAAALHSQCDIVWSEDMQHGLIIDGCLQIRNPFV